MAVIPARSGSKGVPNKNIRSLNKIPLIAYSIAAGIRSQLIERVIVSTDSSEYAEIAKKYNAEIPFLRPKNISGDTNTDYEYIIHLLKWLERNEGSQPDYMVILRPVTPLRDLNIIDDAISAFVNNPEAISLRSVHEMSETAYKKCEIDNGYLKTAITGSFALDGANNARQGYPKTYSPNGYIDIFKTSFILKHNLLFGDRVMAFETARTEEIDTIEDFEYLKWLVKKNNHIMKSLFGDT